MQLISNQSLETMGKQYKSLQHDTKPLAGAGNPGKSLQSLK